MTTTTTTTTLSPGKQADADFSKLMFWIEDEADELEDKYLATGLDPAFLNEED